MEQVIGIWLVRLPLAAAAGYGFGSSAYLLTRAALTGIRVRRSVVIRLVRKIGLACLLGTCVAAIGMAMASH